MKTRGLSEAVFQFWTESKDHVQPGSIIQTHIAIFHADSITQMHIAVIHTDSITEMHIAVFLTDTEIVLFKCILQSGIIQVHIAVWYYSSAYCSLPHR